MEQTHAWDNLLLIIVITTLDTIFVDNSVDHLIDDRRSVRCTNWQLAEAVIDTE